MIHFFIVYRVYVIIFLVFISSCMTKDTQILSKNEYPFKEFVEKQSKFLGRKGLKKTMWLNNKEEKTIQSMSVDTWKNELSFFKEIDPYQKKYMGTFKKNKNDSLLILNLKPDEKGILKRFEHSTSHQGIRNIKATTHEEQMLYIYHCEFEITLKNDTLADYSINGYQKILLKDSIHFKVFGEVLINLPTYSSITK